MASTSAERSVASSGTDPAWRRWLRVVWSTLWSALLWPLFVGVTVTTLLLWMTEGDYSQTTPVSDLSFLVLGAMIGAGFTSQARRHPPIAGGAQALLAAAALALAGLAGGRVEPMVGGVLLTAAASVSLLLHPRRRGALATPRRRRRDLAGLVLVATVPAVGYAAVMLGAARSAGPSCFLGQCAGGDRLAEMAATAVAIPALAALAARQGDGWRLPLWSAGLGAVTVGAASLLLPHVPGSLGILGGTATAVWGVALIALGGRHPVVHTQHHTKGDVMNVLVAYATRHGSTAGIAEHVAATLTEHGHPAQARPVEEVDHLDGYEAVVLGGAAYMFHWLKPAVRFARKNSAELARRPVWLFSSGPLGTDLVDDEGHDVLQTTRPKEFDDLTRLLKPRGEHVFFGAYDPEAPPVGIGERLTRRMPAARDSLPSGDFRDWDSITSWAKQIASELDES